MHFLRRVLVKYRTEKMLAGRPKRRKMRRRVAKNLSRPELLKIAESVVVVLVSLRSDVLVWFGFVDISLKG